MKISYARHPEITKDYLLEHYVKKGKGIQAIAFERDCSAVAVRKKLHKYGIPIRKRTAEDLTGREIGWWTVLFRLDGSPRHIRYRCRCRCGEEKNVRHSHLLSGLSSKCTRCAHPGAYKHSRWKGCGELSGRKWREIIWNSTKRGNRPLRKVRFEISIEFAWDLFLKQERECALSGLPIRFQTDYRDRKGGTASLDRIDPDGHYTEDNVQWVHKDVNLMKTKFAEPYFIGLCRKIAERTKDRECPR